MITFRGIFAIGALALFLVLLAAPAVQAQGAPPFPYFPSDTRPLLSCSGYYCGDAPEGTPETKCTSLCDLLHTGQNFLYFGLTLLMVVIVPLMLVIGFIFVIISAGSRERLGTGRNIIKGGILALLLGMGAFVLLNTFFKGIGIVAGGSAGGGWSTINCNPEELPGTIDPEKLCLDVGGTGGGGRGGGGTAPATYGCYVGEGQAICGRSCEAISLECEASFAEACKKIDNTDDCIADPLSSQRSGCWVEVRRNLEPDKLAGWKFTCNLQLIAEGCGAVASQCATTLPSVQPSALPPDMPWGTGCTQIENSKCGTFVASDEEQKALVGCYTDCPPPEGEVTGIIECGYGNCDKIKCAICPGLRNACVYMTNREQECAQIHE